VVLPDIELLYGTSISELAQELFKVINLLLDHTTEDWSLSIIEPSTVDTGVVHNRGRLIEKQVMELLDKRRRGIRRRLTERRYLPEWLLQVVLIGKDTLGVSILRSQKEAAPFTRTLTNAANYICIEDDKQPPSRAFKKLVEARLLWGRPFVKGQHAVDLGACPGGWTHIAQSWGLTVTAIDRSPLAEHLMRSRRVQFIRGDAFTWVPDKKVDWLLCDVISAPERTKELLQRWITEKLASYFCVTMKFKGDPPVSLILELKGWMLENTKRFDVIPLTNNKHEITWVGVV
jgi:23S rRNA (cytidine2498-2'-O)-methyltransferase